MFNFKAKINTTVTLLVLVLFFCLVSYSLTFAANSKPTVVNAQAPSKTLQTNQFDNAQFIAQKVPLVVEPNKKYTVSLTFKNTGKTTWRKAKYSLLSQNPTANNIWGIKLVELTYSDIIRPGASKTFTFQITAPIKTGTYEFQWQMFKEVGPFGFFGQKSANLLIKVNSAPELSPIPNESTYEHKTLEFKIQASDSDRDNLTYTATNLPTGATFNTTTQTFNWIPQYGQAGTYTGIHFTVSDDIATASQDASVNVIKTVVFGTIYEKNQQGQNIGLADVTVDVMDLTRTNIIASGTTDATGHFDVFYQTWTDGTYIIRVSKTGYRTYFGAATLRGNSMMPFMTVLVENIAPSLEITSPQEGQIIRE